MPKIEKTMSLAEATQGEVTPMTVEPEFEYVEVPKKDIFGFPFTGVSVNFDKYGPGQHKVSPVRAAEIRRILHAAEASDLKTLSPSMNPDAVRILASRGIEMKVNQ